VSVFQDAAWCRAQPGWCDSLCNVQELKGGVQYRDRRFDGDNEAYARAIATSKTVYVGNLAFTTREEQIYEVFLSGQSIVSRNVTSAPGTWRLQCVCREHYCDSRRMFFGLVHSALSPWR
jgi:hypothetical protein